MKRIASFFIVISIPVVGYAWTGPSAAPPGNNVAAPVTVSSADQFKPGVMGANILNIYGSSQYLSFGNTTGASGFGIRNNGGTLEMKHSGGAWTTLNAGLSITGGGLSYNGHIIAEDTADSNFVQLWADNSIMWGAGGSIGGLRFGSATDTSAGGYTQRAFLSDAGRLDVTAAGGNGGYTSSGNYGGTGTAAYFPAGIWSNGANAWIYGTVNMNGAQVDTAVGTVRDAGGGWLRTYGATGWYSQTYGGGWHMSDSTWLRAYGNKYVYTPGVVRGDAYVASNQFCDPGATYCSSAYGLWYLHTYYYSDKRLNEDIKDMSDDYGLGAITQLRPVQFTWKDKTASEKLGPQIGLIAQEVEQVIPEAVDTMPDKKIKNEDGSEESISSPKSVTYQNLVVPLIKSVQQLKELHDAQQKEINALKAEVEALRNK